MDNNIDYVNIILLSMVFAFAFRTLVSFPDPHYTHAERGSRNETAATYHQTISAQTIITVWSGVSPPD